jgi:HD-GYP domain-containing protein (c-di-GMP phosphodiesterase class II)
MESVLARETRFDTALTEVASRIDDFTRFPAGHSERVAELAGRLAREFHLADEDRRVLETAALIRDIGELRMSRDYIAAPRILTAEERLDLRRHPVIGEQEAASLKLGRDVQLVVRWHHEWWNGKGYPDELTGETIPLKARILRVADAWCALLSPRPFRAAYPAETARKYLIEWAAIEFDPAVVKAHLDLLEADALT